MRKLLIILPLVALGGPIVAWYVAFTFLSRAANPQL